MAPEAGTQHRFRLPECAERFVHPRTRTKVRLVMSPGLTEAVIEGFEHGGLVFGVVKASPVVGGKDAGIEPE